MKRAIAFWSINYYTRHIVDARLAKLDDPRSHHKELKMVPMKFYLEEMYPEGLVANLERLRGYPAHPKPQRLFSPKDHTRASCQTPQRPFDKLRANGMPLDFA